MVTRNGGASCGKISLCLTPPGRCRRKPKTTAETAVEIRQVVKAAVEGDVADPPLARMRQTFGGLAQPQFGQPHRKAGAGLIQQFIDIALRQPGRGGELLCGKIRLGKTL